MILDLYHYKTDKYGGLIFSRKLYFSEQRPFKSINFVA